MDTSFTNGSNPFFCYFSVVLLIISNIVFCMHYIWFVLFLLMETDLKSSDRKQEETSCLLMSVQSPLALLADAPLIYVTFSLHFRSCAESDAVPLWLWLTSSKL